jgi:2-phospho-L-lactate transferase/gluconeogenesis factor (CofD/UPF0052 family)
LFSGGRGSGALTAQLVANPGIALTIAINGYDDGASTGEVRRFLGDALGPSDFRKNAVRLARLLATCPAALTGLLDLRLDASFTGRTTAADLAATIGELDASDPRLAHVRALAADLPAPARDGVALRLRRFASELESSAGPFRFADCSVGNLVFGGGFLLAGRDFNRAVDDYCALVGLPTGLVENVTDGTNAFLVALDADATVLGSEEEIVDAKRRNRIDDIFLIDRRLTPEELRQFAGTPRASIVRALETRTVSIRLNPRLERAIEEADLIVYAPGTQHSSLFPSYLTPGLSAALSRNLTAIKLLVTNIQADAEITGSSAMDIIDRAVFYLKEKNRLTVPTPCLITHYLVNDPAGAQQEAPYVPLGRLESIEDPRLLRVANYEDGLTGRHDAAKILGPFVESFLARRHGTQRLAVLLYEASTANKAVQSLLEMARAGIRDLPVEITVFHDAPGDIDAALARQLGIAVRRLTGDEDARDAALRAAVHQQAFDYLILFESSGMYNGEDIVTLASHLAAGRLDAVWGSRRLSVRDIHASYRLRYRHNAVLGAISYAGSHALSLLYLSLYGRYISDTLSGARAVRVADALRVPGLLTDKLANQRLLSVLLRRKAEMLELPVQFFAISPQQVRRTSPVDGLRAIAAVVAGRVRADRSGLAVRAPDRDADLRSATSFPGPEQQATCRRTIVNR